jgi:hypothetical protein
MNGPKREFDLRPNFLRELANLEAYVGQSNPRKGRKFVSELFDFISDVVEPNTYAFPEDPLLENANARVQAGGFPQELSHRLPSYRRLAAISHHRPYQPQPRLHSLGGVKSHRFPFII